MFERKLAQSVQRDYLAAAEQHRLLEENSYASNSVQMLIRIGLVAMTIALAILTKIM